MLSADHWYEIRQFAADYGKTQAEVHVRTLLGELDILLGITPPDANTLDPEYSYRESVYPHVAASGLEAAGLIWVPCDGKLCGTVTFSNTAAARSMHVSHGLPGRVQAMLINGRFPYRMMDYEFEQIGRGLLWVAGASRVATNG